MGVRAPLRGISSTAEIGVLGCTEVAWQYRPVNEEYRALRESAALLDHSGVGLIRVTGPGATDLMQRAAARDVEYMFPERCLTTLLLDSDGDIVDLVVIYRVEDGYSLETSFGRSETTAAHLVELSRLEDHRAVVSDASGDVVILGLEGPGALECASEAVDDVLASLPFQGVASVQHQGSNVVVSRTGYTGEYGYKFLAPSTAGQSLSEALLRVAEPVGMRALEVAMLEVRQPILHRELGTGANAVNCGFQWLVESGKPDFVGREALMAQHESRDHATVGFETRDTSADLLGSRILVDDLHVGSVVFAAYSPGRGNVLGIARIESSWAASGIDLKAETRIGRVPVRTLSSPYVVPRSWGGTRA